MKKVYNTSKTFYIVILVIALLNGCDIYNYDGNENSSVTSKGGYFYLVDKDTGALLMLDEKLQLIESWDLPSEMEPTSVQGLTDDGKYLWLSSAGSADKLFQVDISGDSVVITLSFDAPPTGRGTIRDITWDGINLWAINSGSSTYNIASTLYKLNPLDGTILSEVLLQTPEPRGLCFVKSYADVYGKGPETGLYFSDVDRDFIYYYRVERPLIDSVFTTPLPPRGNFTKYISGITNDGVDFWLVNSSDVSDILYKVSYNGVVKESFNLPFTQLGPIVWSKTDYRNGLPPSIDAVSPSTGLIGSTLDIDIFGDGFKPGNGLNANFGSGITVNTMSFVKTTQLSVNITIAGDATPGKRNLTISNPDGQTVVKDSVFEITQTQLTPYLWVADQSSGQRYLYKIRLTDTTVVQEWSTSDITSDGIQGVAYDGADIWLSSSGSTRSLINVDVSGISLAVNKTLPLAINGGTIRGITWGNNYLWVAVSAQNGGGSIFRLDPSTGSVLDSISSAGIEVRGITFIGNDLYCNDTSKDSVFVYNISSKNWSGVFETPIPPGGTTSNRFSTGLTFDGQSFWMANSTGDFDYIFKVSQKGIVLQTFGAPRKGDAQITGISYTLLN